MKPKIKLTRKRLRAPKSPDDGCRINTTWKAGHILSPEKSLVDDYRAKWITASKYRLYYRERNLDDNDMLFGWMEGLRDAGVTKVTLLCHCGEDKFCHTHIAIDWLCEHFPDIFEDARTVKYAHSC